VDEASYNPVDRI